MTEYEKCLHGLPFDGAQAPMTNMVLNARKCMKRLRETDYEDQETRITIFKEMLGSIGDNVYIDWISIASTASIYLSAAAP